MIGRGRLFLLDSIDFNFLLRDGVIQCTLEIALGVRTNFIPTNAPPRQFEVLRLLEDRANGRKELLTRVEFDLLNELLLRTMRLMRQRHFLMYCLSARVALVDGNGGIKNLTLLHSQLGNEKRTLTLMTGMVSILLARVAVVVYPSRAITLGHGRLTGRTGKNERHGYRLLRGAPISIFHEKKDASLSFFWWVLFSYPTCLGRSKAEGHGDAATARHAHSVHDIGFTRRHFVGPIGTGLA